MVTVARDSAHLGFAFDDEDLAVDPTGERGSGGQPRRPASDDRHRDMLFGHRLTARIRNALVCAAVEALAAAVHDAGATPQPVEIGGWDGGLECVAELTRGDPLAEADDAAVFGVGGDSLGIWIRAEVGVARFGIFGGAGRFGRSVTSKPASSRRPVTYSAIAIPEVSPVDQFADEQVARLRVDVDQIVVLVDRGTQPGVGGGDLLVEQRRHQRAAFGHQELEALLEVPVAVRSSRFSDVGPTITLP